MPQNNTTNPPAEMKRPSNVIMRQRFYHKAQQLEPKTYFKAIEIEALLRIFDQLVDKYKSPMNRLVFKDILYNFFSLTNDIMLEKIFRSLTNGKSVVSHEEWISVMNIYLRGTSTERANFAFTVYDQQRRGFLSKEDVQLYLKDLIVVRIPEEDLEECHTDLLDMVFVLLDRDKDGYINRNDFMQCVEEEPLLLQLLGECLPPANATQTLDALIRHGESIEMKSE